MHALHHDDRALQPEAGARPLDEQALVLAPDGPLRPVGTHRDKAQERIEIEAAQGAGVAADAQVALREEGLCDQRQTDGERRCQDRERRARRIEPGNPHGRQGKLEDRPQELPAEVRQEPERLKAVAALGHVRGQPALEVPVVEAGNLLQERHAQARLEVPPEA